MKRYIKWIVIAIVVILIALGVLNALKARRAQQEAVAQASVVKVQSVVELAPTDVFKAQVADIAQGLPISGSIRAFDSAVVKARTAGELQGLTVREGDVVKAGQIIARIDPTDSAARMKQAQEQADSAKTQIDIAQRSADNNKALVDQGFISKTALDNSLNSLSAAQANHKAALASVDMARKGVDDTVLRAPISGVVAQRLAQPGERVAIEARIVEIVDLTRLEMEASMSAADSVGIRVGQEASLQVEGNTRAISAKVARINPSAQAGSRSVIAYLAITDPAGLRQGLFAQGTIGTGRVSTLAVPLTAIRTDKPMPYVQVVENNQVAHKQVTTGARGDANGDIVVAVTGVAAGATVIKGNLGPLREGTAVKFTGAAVPSPLPSPDAGASNSNASANTKATSP